MLIVVVSGIGVAWSLEESAVEMEGTFEIEDALRNGGRSRNRGRCKKWRAL